MFEWFTKTHWWWLGGWFIIATPTLDLWNQFWFLQIFRLRRPIGSSSWIVLVQWQGGWCIWCPNTRWLIWVSRTSSRILASQPCSAGNGQLLDRVKDGPYSTVFAEKIYTDWWFGTWLLFFHIFGIIIPIDFHIFQRGSNHQPLYMCSILSHDFSMKSRCRECPNWLNTESFIGTWVYPLVI